MPLGDYGEHVSCQCCMKGWYVTQYFPHLEQGNIPDYISFWPKYENDNKNFHHFQRRPVFLIMLISWFPPTYPCDIAWKTANKIVGHINFRWVEVGGAKLIYVRCLHSARFKLVSPPSVGEIVNRSLRSGLIEISLQLARTSFNIQQI